MRVGDLFPVDGCGLRVGRRFPARTVHILQAPVLLSGAGDTCETRKTNLRSRLEVLDRNFE